MFKQRGDVTDICIPNIFKKDPKSHIVILTEGFTKSRQGEYLVKIAEALDFIHHRISIFACINYGEDDAFEVIHPITGYIRVQYLGQWIPDGIYGWFKHTLRRCKAIWMALQLALFPPTPRPEFIFVHMDSIVLPILSWCGQYKTIYVYQYPIISGNDRYKPFKISTNGNLDVRAVMYANHILVENECLKKVFQRIYPQVFRGLAVIYPPHDVSDMIVEDLQIEKIIPRIRKEHFIFVAFGDYDTYSNFELLLDALDSVHIYTEGCIKEQFYVVIAGNCKKSCPNHLVHYRNLVEKASDTVYKNQVIFLKQACPALRKALLSVSVAVIHPSLNNIYPGPILEAMSAQCAIIATNTGFAKNVLEHKRTALLVDPRPLKFFEAMYRLAVDIDLRKNISSLAYHKFMADYCSKKFIENLEELLWQVKRLP